MKPHIPNDSSYFEIPQTSIIEEFKILLLIIPVSMMIFFTIYGLLGLIYVIIIDGNLSDFSYFLVASSFSISSLSGLIRGLKMVVSAAGTTDIGMYVMSTETRLIHAQDMIRLAAGFGWDLIILIGSLTVFIISYFILPF